MDQLLLPYLQATDQLDRKQYQFFPRTLYLRLGTHCDDDCLFNNAGIIFGQTKAGGITWHDLRHTFATRLRGQGVDELDIMHLIGHSSAGVTAGYAHATPSVIQSAVNKLAEPRGEVVRFARRAS